MNLHSAQEIIDDIKAGKMVILMDDEDRENEGDLIIAAEHISAEAINFMATHGRGLICLTMTQERCEQLDLPLMVKNNGAAFSTNFTMSIEASKGVTTGISAADRARTVQAAIAKGAVPSDIVQPGHIFPIMAQPGGVLTRAGHTEAGCDLARLAGLEASSVIVEILNADGTMARRPDLEIFAKEHGIKIGTIADLIEYRNLNETTIEQVAKCKLPTEHGEFDLVTYKDTIDGQLHYVLLKGEIKEQSEGSYLHRGIAGRTFERRFDLADYVKVTDAHLENGMLHIDLVREVPEAHKPRKIEIKRGTSPSLAEKAKKLIGGETKEAA